MEEFVRGGRICLRGIIGDFVRVVRFRADLVRAFHAGCEHFLEPARVAAVCRVFPGAHCDCLHSGAAFCIGLWICGGQVRARGENPASAARYFAIDPGAELSSRRNAGDGGVVPRQAAGPGTGLGLADLHGTGLEHRVQLLRFAERNPARTAGGCAVVPLQRVAAIHRAGAALCGDRTGVELDDVRGRRLVFSDGLRNVRARRARFPVAGAGFVPAGRRRGRRHARHPVGNGGDDRGYRPAGSAGLAAGDRLVGQIQVRDRGRDGAAVVRADVAAPVRNPRRVLSWCDISVGRARDACIGVEEAGRARAETAIREHRYTLARSRLRSSRFGCDGLAGVSRPGHRGATRRAGTDLPRA